MVLTTPFRDVLERHLGFWRVEGEVPRVCLPHPVQNVPDEVLDACAAQIVAETLSLLPE